MTKVSSVFLYFHNLVLLSTVYGCNEGDLDSIHGSGRSPGEGNGNLLQCPCMVNFMDREAWQATVHGAAKSST